MLLQSFQYRASIMPLLLVLLLLANASAISAVETESDDATDENAGSSADKPAYIEAFPEEGIESYTIHRRQNPANPCDRGLDTYDYETTWYDESQIYINSKFCEPALWFDNFFGDERIFKEGVAGTYVRWRNEFTYDEEDYLTFNMDLNFSVELPDTENRLRITFQGDQDQDLRDISPGNGEQTTNSLGLLLLLKESTRSNFNVNITLTPKILFRYRYTYPMKHNVILRFIQELQREKEVHSARTRFDYEYNLKKGFVFRSSTEGILSEEFDGVDWTQAFVLFQRLNKKTSLAYEAGVTGISYPWILATDYRLGVRFRKNFHREWLFYEIAPDYSWPITLDEERSEIVTERRSKWSIFFRLEVHFGNAYETRYEDYM